MDHTLLSLPDTAALTGVTHVRPHAGRYPPSTQTTMPVGGGSVRVVRDPLPVGNSGCVCKSLNFTRLSYLVLLRAQETMCQLSVTVSNASCFIAYGSRPVLRAGLFPTAQTSPARPHVAPWSGDLSAEVRCLPSLFMPGAEGPCWQRRTKRCPEVTGLVPCSQVDLQRCIKIPEQ